MFFERARFRALGRRHGKEVEKEKRRRLEEERRRTGGGREEEERRGEGESGVARPAGRPSSFSPPVLGVRGVVPSVRDSGCARTIARMTAAECGGYAGAVAASLNRAATAVLGVFLEPYEIPAEPVKFALEFVMFAVLGVPLAVGSALSYMCFEPESKSVRDNVVLVRSGRPTVPGRPPQPPRSAGTRTRDGVRFRKGLRAKEGRQKLSHLTTDGQPSPSLFLRESRSRFKTFSRFLRRNTQRRLVVRTTRIFPVDFSHHFFKNARPQFKCKRHFGRGIVFDVHFYKVASVYFCNSILFLTIDFDSNRINGHDNC